jgi:GTP-binding protein
MRRKLAKSSKRPGMTQSVYFYGLMPNGTPEHPSNAIGYMVDLPGYGFAKAPDDDVNRWQQMTQEFLISRRDLGTLKRLFILIDAR